MDSKEGKSWHLEELVAVRAKRDKLPNDSLLRQALNEGILEQVEEKIQAATPNDLDYASWPYLYGFFALKSDEAIAALDSDTRLVIQHSSSAKIPSVTQFLKTKAGEKQGCWYGGLFDLWTKATAARSGKPFEFDFLLPNRRENDACIQINGRRFHFESSAITQDDESADVWKRFLEDKRLDPSKVLTRPGPYCPPNAKGPSLYYMTLRFYAKVFDKVAKDLNPSKSQFADDEPNVFLVSFSGLGVRSDNPGVGWALDELFADQPKIARAVVPESFIDISLGAWVDFRAKELINQRKMPIEWYCDHSHEVMAAIRRVGAILLFDGSGLANSRINYNARRGCLISHDEIAEIEELFRKEASYWA